MTVTSMNYEYECVWFYSSGRSIPLSNQKSGNAISRSPATCLISSTLDSMRFTCIRADADTAIVYFGWKSKKNSWRFTSGFNPTTSSSNFGSPWRKWGQESDKGAPNLQELMLNSPFVPCSRRAANCGTIQDWTCGLLCWASVLRQCRQ